MNTLEGVAKVARVDVGILPEVLLHLCMDKSGDLPLVADHPNEAQIGLVWAAVIDEIIAGNIRDE